MIPLLYYIFLYLLGYLDSIYVTYLFLQYMFYDYNNNNTTMLCS